MKKIFFTLTVFVLATFLTSCGFTLNIDNRSFLDSQSTTLVVQNGRGADEKIVDSSTVGRTTFGSEYYKIMVQDIPSDKDVVYFEVNTNNVEMTLYNAEGVEVRQSDSAKYFGKIGSGLTSQDLSTQAISIAPTCRGTCIIVNKGYGVVYLRVQAKKSVSSATYDLFVFSDTYKDETEPANEPVNGSCNFVLNQQSIIIAPKEPFNGAIESVEDVDCFSSGANTNHLGC